MEEVDPSPKRGRYATTLAEQNGFAFDRNVSFTEEGHVYHVCGKKADRSVTTLVKQAFPGDFDGPAIARKNLTSWRKNASSKYHACVCDEKDDAKAVQNVLDLWERNKTLGSLTHKAVELHLNDAVMTGDVVDADVEKEVNQFLLWYYRQSLECDWKVFRTELAVYHGLNTKMVTAGQIDVLYVDQAGKLRVVDVKRSDKDLTVHARNWGKFGVGHAAEVPDTDHYRYSLQCWLYTIMLRELGYDTGAPMLVQVHPTQNEAKAVACADMKAVALALLGIETTC